MSMFGGLQGTDLIRFGMGVLGGRDLNHGLSQGLGAALPAFEQRQSKKKWEGQVAGMDVSPQMRQALTMMGPKQGSAMYAQHLFQQAQPKAKPQMPWFVQQDGSLHPAKQKLMQMQRGPRQPRRDPYAERATAAQRLGMQEGSPDYRRFVLTGRLQNGQTPQNKPPSGYRWSQNGNQLEAIPGGPATKLTPEAAGRIAIMEQGRNALPQVRRIVKSMKSVDGRRIGMMFRSGEGGEARRLVQGAIEGVLRGLTGAAATESEVSRLMDMYGPSPTDSVPLMQKKLNRLDELIKSQMKLMRTGRGGMGLNTASTTNPQPTETAPATAPQRPVQQSQPQIGLQEGQTIRNPQTGERAIVRNGQLVPIQ